MEVKLSDENSHKKYGIADMRCLLETRLEGIHPVAVSDEAASLEQANALILPAKTPRH